MTTVFIGGSRHITRLTSDVRARLDRIVSSHLPVVVGDANGADKVVQGDLFRVEPLQVAALLVERDLDRLDDREVIEAVTSSSCPASAARHQRSARRASARRPMSRRGNSAR
jgi:hypothetical protein